MRKIIPYDKGLKAFARQLRNQSTQAEIKLWQYLKGRQLKGFRFHRQKPLLKYIADFYCYELQLVIELDGCTHDFEDTQRKDFAKQVALEKVGLTVLRFTDDDVMNNLEGVLSYLERFIDVFEVGG